MKSVTLIGALMFSQAAFADADASNVSYEYGTVIEAQPLTRTVSIQTPHEECWMEDHQTGYQNGRYGHDDYYDRDADYYRGRGSATSAIVGGVIGGAVGNAVGHSKRNKQVGAVVGAVLGATLGHSIARDNRRYRSGKRGYDRNDDYDRNEGYTRRIERCEVIYDTHEEERIIGYKVRYRYNERTYVARTDSDPGDTIRLRVAVSPVL